MLGRLAANRRAGAAAAARGGRSRGSAGSGAFARAERGLLLLLSLCGAAPLAASSPHHTQMEGGAGGPMRGRGGRGRGGGGGGGGGFRGPASNPRLQRAKNDFCQHFVDTGERPANFIRDSDVQQRFDEYPRLKELIAAKDKRIAERATPPTYKKVDLRTFDLTTLGTKFDVVLIDPPWEEYRRRKSVATGELDDCEDVEVWTPQEIMNLRIDAITDTPSFCFLWCGAGVGLTWGRAMLRKWGFRRCEDICWIKSNRESGRTTTTSPTPSSRRRPSTASSASRARCAATTTATSSTPTSTPT